MKLRNIGGPVSVHRPPGEPGSRFVATGTELDVPGRLAARQPADAIVIEAEGDVRAWPTAQWELRGPDSKRWRDLVKATAEADGEVGDESDDPDTPTASESTDTIEEN